MSQTAKAFVLSDDDLTTLNQLVAKGKSSVQKINRARVLLLSHQKQTPQQVSVLLNLSVATVYNIRKRYIEQTLEQSLTEKHRPGQPRKVTSQSKPGLPVLPVVRLLMGQCAGQPA